MDETINGHDLIIYAIVGVIICLQSFFFLKNIYKILAYKNIIASNDKLEIVELDVKEEEVNTLNPDYFLENKDQYIRNKDVEINKSLLEDDDLGQYVEYADSNREELDDFDDELNLFN